MPRLTLGQALKNAMEGERAASRLYAMLATRVKEAEARTFLEDMSAQEAQPNTSVGEVTKLLPPVPLESLGFVEAVGLAIEAESQAHALYGAMAAQTRGMVSRFFTRMATAELQHAEQLQNLLDASRSLS
jgi:rubrerythrin